MCDKVDKFLPRVILRLLLLPQDLVPFGEPTRIPYLTYCAPGWQAET